MEGGGLGVMWKGEGYDVEGGGLGVMWMGEGWV